MGTVSEADRDARRRGDREKSRQAVEALVSSEGWQRWLACRRHFHRYSVANQLLIAMQCPEATMVAGFRAWNAWLHLLRHQPDRTNIFAWLRTVAIRETWRLAERERRETRLDRLPAL